MGHFLPPLSNKTKPSACTHARLSQHGQLQWTHEPARGETNSFLLTYSAKDQQRALRTQNHRGAQVASSEHGLLHKSTRETLRHSNGQLTCLHLVRLNRPFKVRGRIKPDGRDAQREKHVRLSPAALPDSDLYHSDRNPLRLSPGTHAEKQMKRTQSECINTHRCRVVIHLLV